MFGWGHANSLRGWPLRRRGEGFRHRLSGVFRRQPESKHAVAIGVRVAKGGCGWRWPSTLASLAVAAWFGKLPVEQSVAHMHLQRSRDTQGVAFETVVECGFHASHRQGVAFIDEHFSLVFNDLHDGVVDRLVIEHEFSLGMTEPRFNGQGLLRSKGVGQSAVCIGGERFKIGGVTESRAGLGKPMAPSAYVLGDSEPWKHPPRFKRCVVGLV